MTGLALAARHGGRTVLLAATALALTAGAAVAQANVSLDVLRTEVTERVVNGTTMRTETLVPVTSAVPGDVLTYRITLDNPTDVPAEEIEMNLPVAEETTLDLASMDGSIPFETSVSVDGRIFGALENLTVDTEDGTRPATVADLTSLRVDVPMLAPDTAATLSYKVTVD